jgi:hypothetical protein
VTGLLRTCTMAAGTRGVRCARRWNAGFSSPRRGQGEMKLCRSILGALLLALALAVVVVVSTRSIGKAGHQARAVVSTPAPRPFIPGTRVSISSTTVSVSGGVATLRLSCQKGEAIRLTCRGTVVLQTPLRGGRTAVLGRARFAIPNCCSAPAHVVQIRLDAAGRTLAARGRHVAVRVTAMLDHGEASDTRTLALAGRA